MGMSKNKTRTKDKYRVVYNDTQRIELENEFRSSEYISIPRKQEIAHKLQLSERQIKIWFQNRRAKKRKQLKRKQNHGSSGNDSVVRPATSTGHHLARSIVKVESDQPQPQVSSNSSGQQQQQTTLYQHNRPQQQAAAQPQATSITSTGSDTSSTSNYYAGGESSIDLECGHQDFYNMHHHHHHQQQQHQQQHQQRAFALDPTMQHHLSHHHPQQAANHNLATHHQHHQVASITSSSAISAAAAVAAAHCWPPTIAPSRAAATSPQPAAVSPQQQQQQQQHQQHQQQHQHQLHSVVLDHFHLNHQTTTAHTHSLGSPTNQQGGSISPYANHASATYTNGYGAAAANPQTHAQLPHQHHSNHHHHHHHQSNSHPLQHHHHVHQHHQPAVQLAGSQTVSSLGQHHYMNPHHSHQQQQQQQLAATQNHHHHTMIQGRTPEADAYATATAAVPSSATDPHVSPVTAYSHQFQQAHSRLNPMSIDQHSAMLGAASGVEAT